MVVVIGQLLALALGDVALEAVFVVPEKQPVDDRHQGAVGPPGAGADGLVRYTAKERVGQLAQRDQDLFHNCPAVSNSASICASSRPKAAAAATRV